jgi:hypothetical protein
VQKTAGFFAHKKVISFLNEKTAYIGAKTAL